MDPVSDFTKEFTRQTLPTLNIGRSYFHIPESIQPIKDSIKRDVFSVGLYAGDFKGQFHPSSALVEWIAKQSDARKKVFVNKKAEWLFLCKRNILEDSIVNNPLRLTEGLVLVQNEQDENLGYGLFKQEGKDLVIRNLLDRGSYLRADESGRRSRSHRR